MEQHKKTTILPGRSDSLEAVVSLLSESKSHDYFAYEREGVWHVGVGSLASLVVDAIGKTATIVRLGGAKEVSPVTGSLADIARKFSSEYEGKLFGHAAFNYGDHVRGQEYSPGKWPLLSLMVPITEITFESSQIILKSYDDEIAARIGDSIKSAVACQVGVSAPVNTQLGGDIYMDRVTKAVAEIKAGQYTKVIMSRAIDLEAKVDMPATLLHGRRSNSPARTFSMNHVGFQATGFSPELVVSVHDGKVVTEPLAGTRSRLGTKQEIELRGIDLINDHKEIVEHVISAKEAIKELNQVCEPGTTVVEELMVIRERGPSQHLASTVVGQLSAENDSWNSLDVLFPSITASGIPKATALQAIQRLEDRPRELYAGAVLFVEGKAHFEATLCLRTVFQDKDHQWIQAGAGIIALSKPERELEETKEKLASIAPYIVYASG